MNDREQAEKAIFLEAIVQPTVHARDRFIRMACGDDLRLLTRIQCLLEHHEVARGPLDSSPPRIEMESVTHTTEVAKPAEATEIEEQQD